MLIPKPDAVQQEKNLLLLMILDILSEDTSADQRITKEELRKRIEERFGFSPARNTLYDKLHMLEIAGFGIVAVDDGIYLDTDHMTDGALRYLVDSVLYSDFVTHTGAKDIIDMLKSLGSPAFRKYIEKQTAKIRWTRKNTEQGIFIKIEDVQNALFQKRQICFNEITYTTQLKPVPKYMHDLTVNPYELICKNGRYYLIGAIEGEDTMRSWRIDRIGEITVLETHRTDIPQYTEVMRSGGMGAYADAQPELCGGKIETFTLQVSDMAIDEIVDAFGMNFRIVTDEKKKPDPDVVIIKVKATRESVQSWAIVHAARVIILEPEDMRAEIQSMLYHGCMHYNRSLESIQGRARHAESFAETVRLVRLSGQNDLTYHADWHKTPMEKVNAKLCENLRHVTMIRLSCVEIRKQDFLSLFPNLKTLFLHGCRYDSELLQYAPQLCELRMTQFDDTAIRIIPQMKQLRTLELHGTDIKDISFLSECTSVSDLILESCDELTDCSVLVQMKNLRSLRIDYCTSLQDFRFLESMTQLKELSIDSKHFHWEDANRLQKKLPGCRLVTRGYNDDEYYF